MQKGDAKIAGKFTTGACRGRFHCLVSDGDNVIGSNGGRGHSMESIEAMKSYLGTPPTLHVSESMNISAIERRRQKNSWRFID